MALGTPAAIRPTAKAADANPPTTADVRNVAWTMILKPVLLEL
jgi:hypothetical protein